MKNKNLFLFCLMMLGMHSSAFAVVNCTWAGNTSATWSNPANWSTDPNLPGDTDSSRAYFANPVDSVYMPILDSAQPSGSFRIQELAFQSSGWTLGGTAPLTLDKGAIQLPQDTSNPYIRSNGGGTNTSNALWFSAPAPVAMPSPSQSPPLASGSHQPSLSTARRGTCSSTAAADMN